MKLGEKFYQAAGGAQGAAPNPEDFAGYGNPGADQGAAGGDAPEGGFKSAGGDF
jgi:hypothetical protein